MTLKTVNNIKNQKAFMDYSQKANLIGVLGISLLLIIIGILSVAEVIPMGFFGVWGLIFGIMYPVFYLGLIFYIRSFAVKKNPMIGENILNTFNIEENSFTIETKKDGSVSSTARFEIDKFKKAAETKDYIFIWLSRQYAYIISKSENDAADIDGFVKILTEKLGTNFKRQK